MQPYLLVLISSLLACAPPTPTGELLDGNHLIFGDAGINDGGMSDAADKANTPTICDLHATGAFASCIRCHGYAGNVTFNLDTPQSLYDSLIGRNGLSGNPLVVPGDADASWLWVRINEQNGQSSMPPEGKLEGRVRQPIRDWLNRGQLDSCL
jgi:hypothetical protein